MTTSLQLATLSHDMKTPLSAIALYNSLLSEMPPDAPERKAYHDIIALQVGRLSRMARNALEEAQPPKPQTLCVRILLQETTTLYARLHPDYVFEQHASSLLPDVIANRDAVYRVLTNLLDNAIKFSTPHTITLTATLHDADQVCLSVMDRGPGIPERHQMHLFEPHYRINTTQNGQGLGLFIARRIANEQGGHLTLESRLGTGTTVQLFLPCFR